MIAIIILLSLLKIVNNFSSKLIKTFSIHLKKLSFIIKKKEKKPIDIRNYCQQFNHLLDLIYIFRRNISYFCYKN